MTREEQTLADDKMRAEIAKLIAETLQINSQRLWIPITIASGSLVAVVTIIDKLMS